MTDRTHHDLQPSSSPQGQPPPMLEPGSISWLLARQCRLAPASGGVLLRWMNTHAQPEVVGLWPEIAQGAVAPAWVAAAARAAERLRSESRAQSSTSGSAAWFVLPLADSGGTEPGAFVAAQLLAPASESSDGSTYAAFLLKGARSDIGLMTERLTAGWSQGEVRELRSRLAAEAQRGRACSLIVELAGAVSEQTRLRTFATSACDQIAATLSCDRASLGLGTGWRHDGRSIHVLAMSHTERILRGAQPVQLVELAMEECADQDTEIAAAPSNAALSDRIDRAARELAAGSSRFVLSLPIRTRATPEDEPLVHIPGLGRDADRTDRWRVRGVLTVEKAGSPIQPEEILALRSFLDILSPQLIQLAREDRWPGARLAMIVRSWLAVLVGPRHTWMKLAAIATLAALAFVFIAKGTYRVECACRLEAIDRQIIPAPFDGYLRETMVRAGDQVVAGQTLLARLDDTELRLRLAEARAEAAAYQKELAVARQDAKTAEAQIAEAQADKVQARINLLQHQLQQAALVAPISGVILIGDLERARGAPVQTGQTLFEIAPPEKLRVELSVPESQIGDVAVGQRGEFSSHALPGTYVKFVIERIDPVAQVVDQDNVFRVRARIESTALWMRPGIEGLARVDVEPRPYAAIWSRRLVNWIRMKLWI